MYLLSLMLNGVVNCLGGLILNINAVLENVLNLKVWLTLMAMWFNQGERTYTSEKNYEL